MQSNNITIINFEPNLSTYVKALNYEWLQKYFTVEPTDVLHLGDPQKYIIDKGGFIYFIKLNNEIVGTASLLKITATQFELGKMAITYTAQGHGLGGLLLTHCIAAAKAKNISTLILYSNTILKNAIYLYKKFGFVAMPLQTISYKRSNIKMVLQL